MIDKLIVVEFYEIESNDPKGRKNNMEEKERKDKNNYHYLYKIQNLYIYVKMNETIGGRINFFHASSQFRHQILIKLRKI